MKKFLLVLIFIITFVFFDLPTRTLADAQTYYIYRVAVPGVTTFASGPSNLYGLHALAPQYISFNDIISASTEENKTFKYDHIYLPFLNTSIRSVKDNSGTDLGAYVKSQAEGRFYTHTYNGSGRYVTITIPYFVENPGYLVSLFNYNWTLNSGFESQTYVRFHTTATDVKYPVTVTYTNYFVLVCTQQIFGSDTQLIGIQNSINDIRQTLLAMQGVLQDGFSQVNEQLLAILNAINQSSSSGGGTAAIVGAVNGVTGAVNQVLAQQKVSSADIVGAVNSQTSAINNALGVIDASVKSVTDELQRQANETMAAVQKGNEIVGMATQEVESVKSKWDALLVPLDFTKQIFEVFSGGTESAAYTEAYANVLGYKYDSDTGDLVPILRKYKQSVPKAVNGTVLTFPSFSLFVPGVGSLKLWDEYAFDIATIKEGFPVIFDAIYLVSGVLMIYWVIAYLIDYFNDIF